MTWISWFTTAWLFGGQIIATHELSELVIRKYLPRLARVIAMVGIALIFLLDGGVLRWNLSIGIGLDVLITMYLLSRSMWESLGYGILLGGVYALLEAVHDQSNNFLTWNYLVFYLFMLIFLLVYHKLHSNAVTLGAYFSAIIVQTVFFFLGWSSVEAVFLTVFLVPVLGLYTQYWTRKELAVSNNIYHVEHDALTGALTRRGLERWLTTVKLQSAGRQGLGDLTGAIVFCDIDNLKWINDTWGHDVGDAAIRELATRLSSKLRPSDALVRFGGDEFEIWLPLVSREETQSIVDRLHDGVCTIPFYPLANNPQLCLTLGVSMGWSHGVLNESSARKADEALLVAKKTGKHRAIPWTPNMEQQPPEFCDPPPHLAWVANTALALWSQAPQAFVLTDTNGRIWAVNSAYASLVGRDWEHLRDKKPGVNTAGETPHGVYHDLWQTLTSERVWVGYFLNRRADGTKWWELAELYPVTNAGVLLGYWGWVEDLDEGSKNFGQLTQDRFWYGEITFAFQVIKNIQNEKILGYEALVRPYWGNEEVSPEVFFRLAERLHVRLRADWECLDAVLEHVRTKGLPPDCKRLFLNVYAGTLAESDKFKEWLVQLQDALDETRVVIEILETHVHELSFEKLTALHQLFPTVEWAQDDFGIGESDLLRFMGWMPKWVKFDGSLLTKFLENHSGGDLLAQLGEWVSQHGAQVIVEGVETAEQAERLREKGFRFGQGYFWGVPESMDEVESEQHR